MTAKINGSEARRRNRKDRETGRGTINETFRNPTKFHKESFLSFFFFISEKLGGLDVCREKLQGGRMAPPAPFRRPLTPTARQSASQSTEEGRDVLLQEAFLDSNLIASRDTSEARLQLIIKIIILKASSQGVSEDTRYEAIVKPHSISL
jgi:hypothetical protein